MFELPLFPLNTVLFPGMPLWLHIFEDRYQRMMRTCLERNQPFGVVLIAEGVEALGPLAEPHAVGCTARIMQVEPLAEGRMNIVAMGQERFRILSLNHAKPYLTGNVELIPMTKADAAATARAGARLRPLVERYLGILVEAGLMESGAAQLPGDGLGLGYLGAALLQVPNNQKQSLLETRRADAFLAEMNALYRREVALLETMVTLGDQSQQDDDMPFSLN